MALLGAVRAWNCSPENCGPVLRGRRNGTPVYGRFGSAVPLVLEVWYAAHPSSVAVSREHRPAKTDRLDTELPKRGFLGWLRGDEGIAAWRACRRLPKRTPSGPTASANAWWGNARGLDADSHRGLNTLRPVANRRLAPTACSDPVTRMHESEPIWRASAHVARTPLDQPRDHRPSSSEGMSVPLAPYNIAV